MKQYRIEVIFYITAEDEEAAREQLIDLDPSLNDAEDILINPS